ncbi:MAG: hypothetical protein GY822_15165 [Deltaproteobacteria bacterium]|nr:hypothetical protein [Deltaproteobacteria bacterium]
MNFARKNVFSFKRWLIEGTRSIDTWVMLSLFFFTVLLLSQTSQSVGFTRDEGYYFKAGELYFGWFKDLWRMWGEGRFLEPFTQVVIDKHWSYNHEHPVLMKTLFALSWGIGKEWLGVFDSHASAFRFPTWCFAGLTNVLLYALGKHLHSRRVGIVAILLWMSLPRAFWQMHLACFDIPVCAAHLWLVGSWFRFRGSWKGAFVIALSFALAVATKHNVLVTPALFVFHWILAEAKRPQSLDVGIRIPPLPVAFFTLAFLSPILFTIHWPYLWPAPLERIGWWLGFHLQHEHYPILWFKELLIRPPFPVSFPFVMSAVTMPVPVLILLVSGTFLASVVTVRFLWDRLWNGLANVELVRAPLTDASGSSTGNVLLQLLMNAAFPFALIALPSSPIFGGTKHWMNALPFLCLIGAWALEEAYARLKLAFPKLMGKQLNKWGIPVVMTLLCALPGTWYSMRIHPYGLSSYNALVGFARGAANVGLQRTFWGYESREALPFINEHTRKNGSVHFGDTNRDDYKMYKREGFLRKDIRLRSGVRGADVASVQPQGEFKKQWMKVLNQWKRGPDKVVHIEGVPLLTVTFKEERVTKTPALVKSR